MSRPTMLTSDDVTLAGRRWLTDEAPVAAVVLVHGFCASSDDPAVGAVAGPLDSYRP